MNRISKDLADEIAIKLTSKKLEAIKKIDFEIGEIAYTQALKSIPRQVLECYEKHKKYFHTNSSVTLTGQGLNREQANFNKKEVPGDGSWTLVKEVDAKTAAQLVKLFDKKKQLKKRDVTITVRNQRNTLSAK